MSRSSESKRPAWVVALATVGILVALGVVLMIAAAVSLWLGGFSVQT